MMMIKSYHLAILINYQVKGNLFKEAPNQLLWLGAAGQPAGSPPRPQPGAWCRDSTPSCHIPPTSSSLSNPRLWTPH